MMDTIHSTTTTSFEEETNNTIITSPVTTTLEQQVQTFWKELSILRISGGLSKTTIQCRLKQAKAYPSITSLSCYRIDFDSDLTNHMVELLKQQQQQQQQEHQHQHQHQHLHDENPVRRNSNGHRRYFESMELRCCQGHVGRIVETVLASSSMKRLSLVDNGQDLSAVTAFALREGLIAQTVHYNKTSPNDEENQPLIHLTLSFPFLATTWKILQPGFSQTTILQVLDLSASQFPTKSDDESMMDDESAVTYLAHALQTNTSINTVDLRRCHLIDQQVAVLIQAMIVNVNSAIETLHLEGNACGTQTLLALTQLLSPLQQQLPMGSCVQESATTKNRSLSSLFLTHEELSEDRVMGLAQFVHALRFPSCTLQQLSLGQYMFLEDDMTIFADSLCLNHTLNSLSLWTCGITTAGIHYFALRLVDMKGLIKLAIPGDAISVLLSPASCEGDGIHPKKGGLTQNVYLRTLNVPPECQLNDTIRYYLDLNRGGRRLLREPNIPSSLWPLVLARAFNTVTYVANDTHQSRLNVLYCLLRYRILLEYQNHSRVNDPFVMES